MVNVVTQLFLWQCSIANCWSLPEDKSHIIPLITNVNPLLNHENHHQIITCRSSTLKKRGGHWSRYLDEFTSARTPLNWPVTSWRRDVAGIMGIGFGQSLIQVSEILQFFQIDKPNSEGDISMQNDGTIGISRNFSLNNWFFQLSNWIVAIVYYTLQLEWTNHLQNWGEH